MNRIFHWFKKLFTKKKTTEYIHLPKEVIEKIFYENEQ